MPHSKNRDQERLGKQHAKNSQKIQRRTKTKETVPVAILVGPYCDRNADKTKENDKIQNTRDVLEDTLVQKTMEIGL